MRYYLNAAPDPQADEKIADINNLYQTAQKRAAQGEATVSTDEMTGVQALERKYPDLPMQPGRINDATPKLETFKKSRRFMFCLIYVSTD